MSHSLEVVPEESGCQLLAVSNQQTFLTCQQSAASYQETLSHTAACFQSFEPLFWLTADRRLLITVLGVFNPVPFEEAVDSLAIDPSGLGRLGDVALMFLQ